MRSADEFYAGTTSQPARSRPLVALAHSGANAPPATGKPLASSAQTLALGSAEQRRIVSGLQLAIFLSAIDSTVVAVALLSIARELGGAELIAWVMAGYTVAATVTTPLYGALSDQYGRKTMMSLALLAYSIGCAGSMLAQSMPQLLALRIVQGIGAGGLLVLSQAAIGDVVPPKERGRFQAWLSGTYALAALIGPVVGGALTAWYGWRFVFAVTLPLALCALFWTRRVLSRIPRPTRPAQPIDAVAVALLATGLTGPLVALTRLGQGAAWHDAWVLTLAALGLTLLTLFWRRQFRSPAPVLAPAVLSNRVVRLTSGASGLVFFAMIGGAVMMPLALQTVAHDSPDRVAWKILFQSLSTPLGSLIAGRMMLNDLRPRRFMVAGGLLGALGAAAIAFVPMNSTPWVSTAMIVLGVGLGLALPSSIVAAQSAVPPNRIGAATALVSLARSFGAALGVALLSSILFITITRHQVEPATAPHIAQPDASEPSTDPPGVPSAPVATAAAAPRSGAAALLAARAGQSDPSIALGFRLVYGTIAAALLLSALLAAGLPAQPRSAAPASDGAPRR